MDAVLKNVKMQGFKQASLARTWRMKSLWFTLIFIMFAILIYEIVKCVQAYNNSPVATTFTLETPDAVNFPQVYLCYGSSLNHSYIGEHKDQMIIAATYKDRGAVTKGGTNRNKRDVSRMFNGDPDDDDIAEILRRSADHERSINDIEIDESENDEYPIDDDPNSELDRVRRAVFGSGSGPGPRPGNGTMNATQLAQMQKAAQAKRIEAMMNATNISDVVYQFLTESAWNVEETFLECEFRSYSRQKLNCKDVIKPIFDANYGMCYLVDLPDDMKQTVAGEGLRLLMNSHINLYPRENEGAPRYAGILVSVNQQYDMFNWLKSLAQPGHVTKIDLEATYVELLNLESGPLLQPCVTDDQGSSLMKIFKGNYSRTSCQMDCLYQAHRQMCQCILPIDKNQVKDEIFNDTTFCGPKQFVGCLAMSAIETEKAVNACAQQCHTPCKSYRYEMRSSKAKLHGPAFDRLSLPPNVTAKNLIELRVAYSRKEIAKLIQSPSSSFADLVSNLGGQINLWMGASMISLLQMIFMAVGFLGWRLYAKFHINKKK